MLSYSTAFLFLFAFGFVNAAAILDQEASTSYTTSNSTVDSELPPVSKRQATGSFIPRKFVVKAADLGLGSGELNLKASEGFMQRNLMQSWVQNRKGYAIISSYISSTALNFVLDKSCPSLPNYVYGVNNVKQFQLVSTTPAIIMKYTSGTRLLPDESQPLVVVVELVDDAVPRIVHYGRGGMGCINNQADHVARDLNSITGTVDITSTPIAVASYVTDQYTPYMGMTTPMYNLTNPIQATSGPAGCASYCMSLANCGGFAYSTDSTAKHYCQYKDSRLGASTPSTFTQGPRTNLFVLPPQLLKIANQLRSKSPA